jgi:hypothetical protein
MRLERPPHADRVEHVFHAGHWAAWMVQLGRGKRRWLKKWQHRADRCSAVWHRHRHGGRHTRWASDAWFARFIEACEYRNGVGMLPEQWAAVDRGEWDDE